MKLRWSWVCLLLVSLVVMSWAQEEEEVEEDEEAQVEDGEVDSEADSSEVTADANISFQVTYKTPVPTGEVFFSETFDDGSFSRWVTSKTMKEDADEDIAKYDGKWEVEALKENKVPGDLGLVLKSRAKHHAIAAPLNKPFIFKNKPLVVQYEVNFQDGIDCGGAYIKLLSDSPSLDLEQFHDRTPYTIMFGPDKCGEDYKLHFIFRHKNPLNGEFEEKHTKRPDTDLRKVYSDKKTHLYTLVLSPDSTYEIFIDQSSVSRGSLLSDVVPPVNPPKEIDDPNDSKPSDWDERAKIPDPESVKPDDWDEDAPATVPDPDAVKPEGWLDDEPEFVPDSTAEKPEDWDEEMDGEWEAPQVPNPACETAPGCGEWKPPTINNPKYKGKWKAQLIDNPNYQGVWRARRIPNPDYFEDLEPFKMSSFRAVGLELWSMTSDIYFDNFIITEDKEVADRWAADSWGLKKLVASANEPGVFSQLALAAEERPWLWIVYVLTVGLPVGLAVLFCWPKKSEDDYAYKKVDPPKREEVEEEEEEEEEGEEEEEQKENQEDADGAAEPTGGRNEEEDEEEEKEDGEGDEEDSEEIEEDEEEGEEGENASEEDDDLDEKEEENSQENVSSGDAAGKYVPPHLREVADSKRKAELERLKRNLKGLINRLSEPNMGSISGQVEEMYMSNSRKDMNDVLTEILMAACVTPALMPDRLLMEHMLLVSVLHHTVGLEVGAHFLETVVRRFDKTWQDSSVAGKESSNLVSMVAHLYNFQVVHSLLLFDILKRLLTAFEPQDVELMLLLLRNVGFSLRKDDPLGLKELISEAQRKAGAEEARLSDQTRVRFMLETMLALKNNDMRKIPGYDPEPVERLRKLQRTLIQNRASGTDVKLRVSLENLLEAQSVGRWWIVGSSWSGAPMINEDKPAAQPVKGEQFSAKVLELARKQRMNTDVRRNIFCVIMTSEDYLDAFEKLLRLGLKGQQERDIVHVLLDCCLQEKTFNAFYAVLSDKFCTHDRRFQMTFQFCLWDKFKELAALSSSSFTNLVLMVTHLLTKNSLSLSILKAIEFGELDKPKVKFLRQILSKLLQQTQEEDLVQIFSRISGIPKLGMLREGLKLFIQHFLLRGAQMEGKMLTERAEVAIKAMEARDAKLKL